MTGHAGIGLVSLLLAAVIWLPSLRLFVSVDAASVADHSLVPEQARELARRQLHLWTDQELRSDAIERMRRSNAEWDFMGRTYLAWGLANLAARDASFRTEALEVIDLIISETVALEEANGHEFFLMDYATEDRWVVDPARSLFVESEIALMIAMRRLVEENESYRGPLQTRVDAMVAAMSQSPVLSAESYPDEAWMFDNANAIAAIRIADVLDATDHSAFIGDWVEIARAQLTHEESGLLVSKYDMEGRVGDGPEGSTIWQVAHALQIVDSTLASSLYRRAKEELELSFLGFSFAREWPASWVGAQDIDSGMIIPVLGIGPSSSGLAMVASSAFGDTQLFSGLLRSLELGGFPVRDESGLRYAASSQLGDAVLLYALTLGPLWDQVLERVAADQESER